MGVRAADGHEVGLLVLGSGPAGVYAASGYREAGGRGVVRMMTADDDVPYARPPLSKDYLRGETAEEALPIAGESFCRDVEICTAESAVQLDTDAHTVTTTRGRVIHYRRCVMATGAEPVRPSMPGVHDRSVYVLRSLASARKLRSATGSATHVVVVGSGFIGCEAAASLARRGLRTSMVCPDPVPQHGRLGRTAGEQLARWLVDEGVRLLPNRAMRAVQPGCDADGSSSVLLDSGESVAADFVLLATGIRPRCELAEQAGIAVAEGRVRTDERMRTSAADVYAAGDVVLAHNPAAGRALPVEHWGEAMAMGEVAGRVAAGGDATWSEVPGFWSVIGDRTVKYAAWGDGFDEAECRKHPGGGFTVWYGLHGTLVGVLTHDADADYEQGIDLVREHAPLHRPA